MRRDLQGASIKPRGGRRLTTYRAGVLKKAGTMYQPGAGGGRRKGMRKRAKKILQGGKNFR